MEMHKYGVVLKSGKIIDINADEVVWYEKSRTVTFINDRQTVARINMDNVAGWIDLDYKPPVAR